MPWPSKSTIWCPVSHVKLQRPGACATVGRGFSLLLFQARAREAQAVLLCSDASSSACTPCPTSTQKLSRPE
eukprot:7732326-Pyramimonas_sp.AAC.1